jgi:hypothetical protein
MKRRKGVSIKKERKKKRKRKKSTESNLVLILEVNAITSNL